MAIDPRCYRNRCHIYSLYWAANVPPPECDVDGDLLEVDFDNQLLNYGLDTEIINPRTTSCGDTVTLTPGDFGFTGSGTATIINIKINNITLSGSGTLSYNSINVTEDQELVVTGGTAFEQTLLYTPDASSTGSYNDTFSFYIKVSGDTEYGEGALLTMTNNACV